MSRLIGLGGAWILCLVVALAGGWPAMWTVLYALGATIVSAWGWATLNGRGLVVRRRHRTRRLQVGDRFSEEVVLEATGPLAWWPRLWLELHDRSTMPGHQVDRVVSMAPYAKRVWTLESECTQRGRFVLGPVIATSSDPFGLFRVSRRLSGSAAVVVLPRTVSLPRIGRVPGDLPGGSLAGVRVPFSTPSVSTVREYAPGDPFNRIHWATTARTGRIMVREFELDPSADVWILLDLHRDVQSGSGPESTEEYAVTAAASLARYFLDAGRSVGLLCQTATLPSDRGPRQLDRILEVLAVVRATSRLRLSALLTAEMGRFARASTVIAVTPSTDSNWGHTLTTLGARGIRTLVVLLDGSSFGRGEDPRAAVGALTDARIPVYVVRQGQPLQGALAAPVGGRGPRG
ncbi:MAG: DUF58 domain-containing protein [Chloroflexi bacterium]|nr:DUF58 domain-containing protein [Chloroflexota bacterium]